jgi:hypothetical protein
MIVGGRLLSEELRRESLETTLYIIQSFEELGFLFGTPQWSVFRLSHFEQQFLTRWLQDVVRSGDLSVSPKY